MEDNSASSFANLKMFRELMAKMTSQMMTSRSLIKMEASYKTIYLRTHSFFLRKRNATL
jgi:hypothetical protein